MESVSVSLANMLFSILLARILMPEDYGVIAILQVFITVAQTITDSGLSNALIRKSNRSEADYSTAFWFNVIVGCVLYVVLAIFVPAVSAFYSMPILTPVAQTLGIVLIINSLGVVHTARLTIALDFKTLMKASVVAVVLSGIAGVVMACDGYGVWSLVVQQISCSCIRTIMLWLLAEWRPRMRFCITTFKELYGFGFKLMISSLINTIYDNFHSLIIGKKFDAKSLGFFTKSYTLSNLPATTISGVIQRVTYPVMSTMQDDSERLKENYRKLLRLSGFVIFPVMIMIAALADPMIRLLLTDKWASAIPCMQILSFYFIWYPINAINLNLLMVKGRSDIFLGLEIIKMALGVIILLITVSHGIVAISVGMAVHSFLSLAVNMYYSGKFIDFGFVSQMRLLLPILLNSIIMGGLCVLIQNLLDGNLLRLLAGLSVGAVYYIGSNRIIGKRELKEVVKMLGIRRPTNE